MEETNTQQTTPEAMENEPIVEVQHTEEQTENVTETPVAAEPVVETPAAAEPAQQPATDEVKDEEPKAEEPEVDYSGKSREELVSALEELLNEDIQVVRTRAAAIRNRFNELNREVQRQAYEAFLSEGGNKDEYEDRPDSVAEAFHSLYERYRARRQQYLESVEQQKQKNYEAKQALIEELRQLVDSGEESMKTVMDNFNDIQDRWKAIGEVPREKMNDLWQNYHFQIEQFFNKLKINRELRALDQKRNLELKLQLCEQAEELIVEPNIQRAAKVLQELRARWKEIGPVPNEQNEEIWQRFTTAANQIDERCRAKR